MTEEGPPSIDEQARATAAVILMVAFVTLLVIATFLLLPVRIDGALAMVARGTTVADLVRSGRVAGRPGNVVSVTGRLLRVGGGGPPTVDVDGHPVEATAVIGPGSWISSVRGPDAVEPLSASKVETTLSMRYVGHGPFISVEESGAPGVLEVVAGSISGEEVSRRVVSRGVAMTIRREPAWSGAKEVALTFDDGPWPHSTDAILAQLIAADAKATFFMLGRQVITRPEMAKRVLAAGMEIGNHSYSHKYLDRESRKTARSEITRGLSAIRTVTGVEPAWYRPAGGATTAFVLREAKRLDTRVVLWTIDPKDWKRPGTRTIARRVLDRVRPGSVILMHDGGGDRTQSIRALRLIIRGLKARGYSMVTLSRLYRLPAATP